MKILLFGATGNIGSRVMTEALSRGHQITAVARNPARFQGAPDGVTVKKGDASNADHVAELSAGHDLAISATRPPQGREGDLVQIARATMEGLRRSGVRLLMVGGAGGLRVPGSNRLVMNDPNFIPPAWRAIAQACSNQLQVCRAEKTLDWAYMSPPALIAPGGRTGRYRLGDDELVVDADGVSKISFEDFAVALLDEAEAPKHHRTLFTVAY